MTISNYAKAADVGIEDMRFEINGKQIDEEAAFSEEIRAELVQFMRYHNEVLYWAGYVYRYWHFLTGESSKDIYKQAPAETMNTNYLMFHCMDTELAIEDLKEIHRQKVKKRSKSGRKAMSDMIQSD